MISATIAIKELIVSTLPFSCYTGTWSPLWGTTCSSGILEAEIGWFLQISSPLGLISSLEV